MSAVLDGKTLLITGGTGSFGNIVLRRFLESDIREVRIFSRDEKKQDDMRKRYADPRAKFYIGDVRQAASIDEALHGVDYVFHAAALKQVPSCEFFPMEAVQTNVQGTENVLNAAVRNGVQKVVCLSTDKAAYPINAMGISKAMMEKVVAAKARTSSPGGTRMSITRYGNVMASRGSVIPLFIDQIRSGADLTVTDPGMTRFLMSLEEAVDLVLFAFENAEPGDLFVQKAPSARVGDLAVALKELFDSDARLVTIGSRHGEKTFETLLTREEAAKAIDMGAYYRVPSDNRDLNYTKYLSTGSPRISDADEYTSANTTVLSVEEIKRKLLEVEYVRAELEGLRGHEL